MTNYELKQIRHSMRLTQHEFAQLLGIGSMTISRWERGVRRIPDSKIKLINYKYDDYISKWQNPGELFK